MGGWENRALDDQLNQCLSESYGTCSDVVKDIQAILDDVNERLQSFEALASKRKKVLLLMPPQSTLLTGISSGRKNEECYPPAQKLGGDRFRKEQL